MSVASEEQVVIVNESNHVVGSAPRSVMRRDNLLHRATYVFVFHPDGRLYAQHRTLTKDIYPGYWDLAAGGVVLAGESYDESAVRELEEEMGIRDVALDPWFEFYFEDIGRGFGKAYGCTWDGSIRPQVEEVQAVELLDVKAVLARSLEHQFTPDSFYALERRLRRTINL